MLAEVFGNKKCGTVAYTLSRLLSGMCRHNERDCCPVLRGGSDRLTPVEVEDGDVYRWSTCLGSTLHATERYVYIPCILPAPACT